jgi:quercetin dioxygenase-like cupin family protein
MDLIPLERTWIKFEHLRHLDDEGAWVPMYDNGGNILIGIEGKCGVRGRKPDGTYIGGDFIRMQPGTAFPLHTHEGEHEIFFISGFGWVSIADEEINVRAGHAIHIPAEYRHAVWVSEHSREPLVFFAVGHPHYHVDATNRMKTT